jgi:heme oxygenase
VRTTEAYVNLLKLFYGYYKPLEDAIEKHCNFKELHSPNGRRKAELIIADLKVIGFTDVDITVCEDIPAIKNEADAVGVMYVLEGSTLGGKIISQMLVKSLQLESLEGVRFFYGYGEQTVAKWNAFKDYVNHFAKSRTEEDRVITAATEAFNKFKSWIEANQ